VAADNIVTVHANGVADRNRGAWAASLAFGEHRRTESGAETGADLERTQLLAVVRALDYLTRPSLVQIAVASPYVFHGLATPERIPDANEDLWRHLERADRAHRLTWIWATETDPAFAEVTELAGTALAASLAGPSVGSVVREFLADRKSRVSARTPDEVRGRRFHPELGRQP
jgi:ribonuclease HI